MCVFSGVSVVLGVDGTLLHLHRNTRHLKFTHVVFNFPHVGGKMRIELNRKLLREFFQSAVEVLEVGGRVVVTLCGGQAGVSLDPVVRRWDDSWKVVLMASYAHLVLRSVERFGLDSYAGYSATGYRSMEKTFCLNGALTFVFEVCKLSSQPLDAGATEDMLVCDGSCITLPSFLHTQIQRDVMADASLFVGYLYNLLVVLLSAHLTVHCRDKLVFMKETQHISLGKCDTVTKCEDLTENTIFCHPSYRINSEQGLQVEPLVIVFCSGDTARLESVLSEIVTLNVRNISHSFTPETRQFAFIDFTEHPMRLSESQGCGNSVTCYIISVATLAGHCGDVEEDEVWAQGQSINLSDDILTYSQCSLFPCQYTYDLSFWEPMTAGGEDSALISDTTKDKSTIDIIIINTGRDALKSYCLLSTYSHPVLRRRSYTYRIVYRSWHGALSDQGAKRIHSQIGQQLEKCLGVEVR